MKSLVWLLSGAAAALAATILLSNRQQPVARLAHQLEDAWADHHTTV